jgi:hypothetical protein
MSPEASGSTEGDSTVCARARPRGDGRLTSGAAPPRVFLAQPARDARLVEAEGVPTDRRQVRHGTQGPTDPVARILRAIDAERHPAITGTLLDSTVAPEAKRRRGAAARADEAVGRCAQGGGEGIEARNVLRGPRAVHGTRTAIGAADPGEAGIDLAVVDDESKSHRRRHRLRGACSLPKDSPYMRYLAAELDPARGRGHPRLPGVTGRRSAASPRASRPRGSRPSRSPGLRRGSSPRRRPFDPESMWPARGPRARRPAGSV